MNFNDRLEKEAVAEWKDHYFNLPAVRTTILALPSSGPTHPGYPALADGSVTSLLDTELTRLDAFYRRTERALTSELRSLADSLGQTDDHSLSSHRSSSLSSSSSPSSHTLLLVPKGASVHEWAQTVHRFLQGLADFRSICRLGLEEALQLHADHTGRPDIQARYLSSVLPSTYIFGEEALEALAVARWRIHRLDRQATQGPSPSKEKLKGHLHSDAPLASSAHDLRRHSSVAPTSTSLADLEKQALDGADRSTQSIWVRYHLYSVTMLLLSLTLFIILLLVPTFPIPEQSRCFALLIFMSLLWATEALPLYVAAFLVPMLVVILGVMRSTGPDPHVLPAKQAASAIFTSMFSPMIMLLLGGFSLASALDKHGISRRVAEAVLSRAGQRPRNITLVIMLVATIASMFVSNVAAPVLCFGLIQPLLQHLPHDSPVARALLLGIALASNVGGMASPISSPQNLIAFEIIRPTPSWFRFFILSIPVCIVTDLLIWALIILIYRPDGTRNSPNTLVLPPKSAASRASLTRTQWAVVFISLFTIAAWCAESAMDDVVGHMGIVAVIPLVAFFGTGILGKEDFQNFMWPVVFLAMGGIALGKAVDSSGLLATIATMIQTQVGGMSVWGVAAVFVAVMYVIGTIVSHTVSALILLPVVAQVGATMADPHPSLLVILTALMCSGAMGLPVSGFPNMNAVMIEDPEGRPYLRTIDFVKGGIPGTTIAAIIILSLGWFIGLTLGF